MTQSDKSKAGRQAAFRPKLGNRIRTDKRAAKLATQRQKTDLVEYIIHHKWAMPSPDREQSMTRIPLEQRELDYFLNCKTSSLQYFADHFQVVLDISKDDALVNIRGELARVNAASKAFSKFASGIVVSHVPSVITGRVSRKLFCRSGRKFLP